MIPRHVPIHSMHRPEHRYIKSFANRLIRSQVLKPLKYQCDDPVSNKGLTLSVHIPKNDPTNLSCHSPAGAGKCITTPDTIIDNWYHR